jgi:hypothetical protein
VLLVDLGQLVGPEALVDVLAVEELAPFLQRVARPLDEGSLRGEEVEVLVAQGVA